MDIDRGAQPNPLAGGVEATPIAQLHPDIRDPSSKVVDGVITITWPYSTIKKSIAFILAEHDVRLRRDRGSLRIEFYGAAGKAVESSGIGAGDRIRLRLEGADWEQNEPNPRLPWTLEWRLRFRNRLHMTIQRDESEEVETIDLDSSTEREEESPEPDYDLSVLFEAQRQADSISTPALPTPISPIKKTALGPENGEYASPAFLKRARVAYGSLLEGGLDWLDDAEQRRKKRRRSGFGMNATWRYSSRSPSPVGENLSDDSDAASEPEALNGQPMEPASQPSMVDQGCQTQELDYSFSMGVQVAAESRLTGKIIQSTPTPHWRYEDLSSSANGPLPLSLHHSVSPVPQAYYQQHGVNGMRQDATDAMPDHDYDFAIPRHHAFTEPIPDHIFSPHHAFKSAPLIIDPNLQFHNIDGHPQGYHTVPAEVWEAEPSMAAHPSMSLKAGPTVSDNISEHTPRSPDMEMPSPSHHTEVRVSFSDKQDAESQDEESHNALGDDYEEEDQHVAGEEETDEEDEEEEGVEEEDEEYLSLQSHDAEESRTDTRRQHHRNQEVSIDNTVDETSDEEERHHWDHRSQDYDASEEQYDEEDYNSHRHHANDYTRNYDYEENEDGGSSEGEEEEEDEEEDEDGYDSEEEEEDEEEYDEIEYDHAPPTLQAPQEPVVISLLSDSEDDDIQAEADKEPQPERTWMSTMTKPSARREDGSEREEVDGDKASEKDVEMGDGSDASEVDEDAENDKADAASAPHRSLSQMDGCDDEIPHETMEVETHVVVEHVIDAKPAEELKMPEPIVEEMKEAEMHEVASPPHSVEPEVLEEGKAIYAPDKEEEGQGAPRPIETPLSFEAVDEPPVSAVDATAMEPPEVETALEVQLIEPTEMMNENGPTSIENAPSPIEETGATNIEARQLDVEDTGSNEVGDAIEQEDIAMKDAIDEPLTQDSGVEGDRNLEQSDDMDMPEAQDEHHHENEKQPDLVEEVAQEQEPIESRNHHLEEPHVSEEEAVAETSLKPEAAEILKAASLPRATRSRQPRLEPLSEEISIQQSSLPVLPHKEAQTDDSFSTAAGPIEQEEEEDEDDLSADQQLAEEFSASQPSCHHSFDGAHDEPTLAEQQHPGRPGRPESLITPHALRSQCRLHRKSLSAESNKIIDENGSPTRDAPIKHCLVDDDLPKSLWFLPRGRDQYSDPSAALARAFEVAPESDGGEKRRTSLSGLFRVSGRQVLDPSVLLAHSTSQSSPRRKGEQQDTSVRPATASPRNTRRQNASPTRSTRVTNSPVSTVADSSFGSEDISIMKTQLLKSLRASLPDCLPLGGLRNSLNKVTDIVAVATSTPMQPHRPRHGPRDYLLEVFLTDPSTAPTGVNVVHIFRPHLSSLPVIHTGDVVLLRRVQVVSMQGRGFGFRAGDASAWAVFERGDEEMLPQIKGPPVEVSDEEVEYAKGLQTWWEALDEKAMEKMDKANRKLSQAVTGSHAHDDSR